jgi:hypothetical protein
MTYLCNFGPARAGRDGGGVEIAFQVGVSATGFVSAAG